MKPLKSSPLPRLVVISMDEIMFFVIRFAVCIWHLRQSRNYQRLARRDGFSFDPVKPVSANDKYAWRKFFDHDPRFTLVSDKLGLRKWLSNERIPAKCPEILWEGHRAADIPDHFFDGPGILKTNHGSGWNWRLPEDAQDRESVRRRAEHLLARKYGLKLSEWAYRDIPPKLFVEEFLHPQERTLSELKFFTFGREVAFIRAIYDRFTEKRADNWLPSSDGSFSRSEKNFGFSGVPACEPLPGNFPEMLKIAREIGSHFDHMRVDLLSDGQNLWAGELTVYANSGRLMARGADPERLEATLWDIRRFWFLKHSHKGWRSLYAAALLRWLDRRAHAVSSTRG